MYIYTNMYMREMVAFVCVLPAMDRNIRQMVPSRNISGHVSPERHCTMGWAQILSDHEIQSPRRSTD